MKRWSLAGMAVAAMCWAASAAAQQPQTIDVARQRHAADSVLHVHVEYGAGHFALAAASPRILYHVHLHYDADRSVPERRFDPASDALSLRLRSREDRGRSVARAVGESRNRHARSDPNSMALGVARGIPLDLTLDLGATEARINLADLWLDHLELHGGASDLQLAFGTPNPRHLRSIEIAGGAASIHIAGLGNANADRLEIHSGAADVDLDCSGAWTRNLQVDLTSALGDVTFHVPSDVGVRIQMTRVLSDFDHGGMRFTKRSGAEESDNWNSAPHRLTIDARSLLGSIAVHRTAS
ncbi:MAG TPA: hypothetical protein VFW98_02940 [Gemmatimonadaceae bacterium]|nr:hypothetical protein [Gemmatimonadaceae bacterium]